MKSENYIIVAGCSRFGDNIASILSKEGKDVIIIDKDSFRKLSNDFTGFKIEGDADIETLIEGRIEEVGTVVAATGDDNVNIMISEIAKRIFNVEKVIS